MTPVTPPSASPDQDQDQSEQVVPQNRTSGNNRITGNNNPIQQRVGSDGGFTQENVPQQLRDQIIRQHQREQQGEQSYSEWSVTAHGYRNVRKPMGKLLLGGLCVVNPLAAGGLYLGDKILKNTLGKVPVAGELYHQPKKLITNISDMTRNAISASVASPLLAVDAARMAGKGIHKIADWTLFEFYRDFMKAINHRFNFAEGTNPLAAGLIGLKSAILALSIYPFKLIDTVAQGIVAHPVRATIAGLITAVAIMEPTALIAAAKELFMTILEAIKSYGAAGAVASVLKFPFS